MKRRNFLGFMAGGAAAGPKILDQTINPTAHGMPVGKLGIYESPAYAAKASDFRKWIAEMVSGREQWLARERLQCGCPPLEPDIAVNRSMSLATKIRINRERVIERNWQARKAQFERDLEEALVREATP